MKGVDIYENTESPSSYAKLTNAFMKEADIMLTAIIVYLIIGAIIVLLLYDLLDDVVKNENLAVKVIYYIAMIVIALPEIIYGFVKDLYQKLKNKSES